MAALKALSLRFICLFSFFFASLSAAAGASNASVDQLFDNSAGSPLVSIINSSKSSIDIEIYTMKDTAVLAALKDALVNRHVHLRIIQADYVLDPCKVFQAVVPGEDPSCTALKNFVIFVRQNGGTYLPFSNQLCGTPGSSCFQHGKILISDQQKVLFSSGNFDATNLCDLTESPSRCNRDFSIVSTDPKVITEVEQVFSNDLNGVTYNLNTILQNVSPSRLTVSPYSMSPLVAFIASAKKTIQIENQYLKDPTLNQALIDAAKKRKVSVFVMTESVSGFAKLDPSKPSDAAQIKKWTDTYTAFDQAGIHTKIFNDSILIDGKPGYLHAKAILVDSKHAWVGSVNGSTESLTENREYGLLSDDQTVVKLLNTVLYQDFTNPNAETWQESLACKKDSVCSLGGAVATPVSVQL